MSPQQTLYSRRRLLMLAGAAPVALALLVLRFEKLSHVLAQSAPKAAPTAQASARLRSTEVPAVATAALGHSADAELSPGTILHIAMRGETVPGLVHRYLATSSYMSAAELESALRQQNPGLPLVYLKPGETVRIPGMGGPIKEQRVGISKTFEVRAIYLTALMAASPRGLDIVRRWREVGGNAVVFDVKDSDGIVNIPFDHPLNVNAPRPVLGNLPKYIRWLHQQGMVAIARVAIFRDERMVTRHPELAVRSRRTGGPWRENGKLVWTDPSRVEVQAFDIALAKAVAQAGADEIQFDYVRFPAEGEQKDAEFDFQSRHPEWSRADVIENFLAEAHRKLKPLGVQLSLDVFGVMAWQRPVDLAHTGQDIARMAAHCDVLSPMIYPSHFYGMDGYAFPGDAPEHFIGESMEKFREITSGSGVVLRPWLQAFGWRTKTYSPQYVITQVRVARGKGGLGFLLWNARNDYSKPFVAMAEMRRDPGAFFRGDEVSLPRLAAMAAGQP